LVGLIGSLPGTIELTDDQLVFTAHKSGTIWPYQLHKLERCVGRAGLAAKLDRGEPGEVLRRPLATVRDVTFPWYSFDNGMNLRVDGKSYVLPSSSRRIPSCRSRARTLRSRAWRKPGSNSSTSRLS
jgi:hypothetical protein